MVVEAQVVLIEGFAGTLELAKVLLDHVKSLIAPYKYPRNVVFTSSLPKTAAENIQRFRLKGCDQTLNQLML